jgi:hypothetical protein
MKHLKLFEQFITERFTEDEIPQLQILLRGTIGLTSKNEPVTKQMMETLYEKYIHLVLIEGEDGYNNNEFSKDGAKIPNNRKHNKIRYNIPLLNFNSSKHSFLDKMNSKIYNKREDLQISADKKLFYEAFAESMDSVPNTVYNLKDIEKLELPIIAKPAEGFSAQGIEKFDSYEDAKKSKMEFDIWQEAKDLDREFRAFIMDGELIHIAERITNSANDMSVGKKDADDKIDLIYIDQDMEKFEYIDQIKKMIKELRSDVNLDFYNIDLMLDRAGTLWVPEINGAPGIGPSMFYIIYKTFVKMAYDIDISKDCEDELMQIADDHRKFMANEYPKEFKKSLTPIAIKK